MNVKSFFSDGWIPIIETFAQNTQFILFNILANVVNWILTGLWLVSNMAECSFEHLLD
jgi:hypothetical protein